MQRGKLELRFLQFFTCLLDPGLQALAGIAVLADLFRQSVQAVGHGLQVPLCRADTGFQFFRLTGLPAPGALTQTVFKTVLAVFELLEMGFKILDA